MARVLVTGSADGLGQLAARALADQGHQVVLHARSPERGRDALREVPKAEHVITGDLSDLTETLAVADAANAFGRFDAVIHNAGAYQASAETIFKVNVIAPYVLTCLIHRPGRLVYLSSGMHLQGRATPDTLQKAHARISYSDSKLLVLMLCKAVARLWPTVCANAVDPGWVPTRMGGPGAPDNLQEGYETQVWLAVSAEPPAAVSGRYFHHRIEQRYHPQADDVTLQEALLSRCHDLTGVLFPR